MAGNTKFIGFNFTKAGEPTDEVFLERWGRRVSVAISPESVAKLRDACFHELPKAPRGRNKGFWLDFNASFDESGSSGAIEVKLSPDGAKKLHEILKAASEGGEAAKKDVLESSGEVSDELLEFVKFTRFAEEVLLEAIEGRDGVFDVSAEPGTDPQ